MNKITLESISTMTKERLERAAQNPAYTMEQIVSSIISSAKPGKKISKKQAEKFLNEAVISANS